MAFYSGTIVKEKPRKKSPILGIFLFFLVALIASGIYLVTMSPFKDRIAYYRCYVQTSVASTEFGEQNVVHSITVNKGDQPLDIGRKLQQNNVIKDASDFLCYVRKIDAGAKIQAGYYEIQTPVSIEQVVPLLQNAQIPTVRVTIPEGLRLDEIAIRIDTAMGKSNTIKKFDSEEFIKLATSAEHTDKFELTKNKHTLEGFLYPDTYDLEKNADAAKVIDLLTSTFTTKVTNNTTLSTTKTLTPYNTVVLASIIEKEAGKNFEEKQTIAGILLKRLANNWLLEVDATFLYEKKDWKATITAQDKTRNTPYNTYLKAGLPPTPICNPGLDSIRAVLSPKDSAYWFYLHGTDGSVHYAKNYDEHLRNIDLYLR